MVNHLIGLDLNMNSRDISLNSIFIHTNERRRKLKAKHVFLISHITWAVNNSQVHSYFLLPKALRVFPNLDFFAFFSQSFITIESWRGFTSISKTNCSIQSTVVVKGSTSSSSSSPVSSSAFLSSAVKLALDFLFLNFVIGQLSTASCCGTFGSFTIDFFLVSTLVCLRALRLSAGCFPSPVSILSSLAAAAPFVSLLDFGSTYR